MMKGIHAVFVAPATVKTSVRKEAPRPLRRARSVPWWLLIMPVGLLIVILLVAALAILAAPWSSDSSGSNEDVEVGLSVVYESEVSEIDLSAPAFSR